MTVLTVERRNPQKLTAVQVSMGNAGEVLALLKEVGDAESPGIVYRTQSQMGPEFAEQDGWRITFSRPDHPDQFAYPGDWILVTDATHSADGGWELTETSEVFVYGISTGLAGTADDFTTTFTEA